MKPPKPTFTRACRSCDRRYTVSKDWQLFCSDACRRHWNYNERGYCFYCGEPGDERDHPHPVAARGDHKRIFDGREIVFSCRECNASLSDELFETIELRVKYLIVKYKKKYKLNVGAVVWGEDELNELGPGLRQRIKKSLAQRHLAERRVAYLEAVFYELLRDLEIVNEERLGQLSNTEPLDDAEVMIDVKDFGR